MGSYGTFRSGGDSDKEFCQSLFTSRIKVVSTVNRWSVICVLYFNTRNREYDITNVLIEHWSPRSLNTYNCQYRLDDDPLSYLEFIPISWLQLLPPRRLRSAEYGFGLCSYIERLSLKKGTVVRYTETNHAPKPTRVLERTTKIWRVSRMVSNRSVEIVAAN